MQVEVASCAWWEKKKKKNQSVYKDKDFKNQSAQRLKLIIRVCTKILNLGWQVLGVA